MDVKEHSVGMHCTGADGDVAFELNVLTDDCLGMYGEFVASDIESILMETI